VSKSKIAISKMEGIRKQLLAALDLLRHESDDGIYTSQWYTDDEVGHPFRQSVVLMTELVEEMPSWFSDFKRWETGTTIEVNDGRKTWPAYSRAQVQQLVRETFQIITLFRDSEKVAAAAAPAAVTKPVLKTAFISHGQSLDWLKVQPYIEKDLKYRTEEFDQNSPPGWRDSSKGFAGAAPKRASVGIFGVVI
jgi:hypothetical protein